MRVKEIANEIGELLERKNSDYGNSFAESVDEHGELSYIIRLDDKIRRYKSLTIGNKEQRVNDESVIDTLKDIAGYTLLMIEYMENKEVEPVSDGISFEEFAKVGNEIAKAFQEGSENLERIKLNKTSKKFQKALEKLKCKKGAKVSVKYRGCDGIVTAIGIVEGANELELRLNQYTTVTETGWLNGGDTIRISFNLIIGIRNLEGV